MSQTNGRPTIITTSYEIPEEGDLSLEEQRRLAGAETPLLDQGDLLESAPQPRSAANAPLPRTALVLVSVGFFSILGLLIAFAFGGGRDKRLVEAPPAAPEAQPTMPDASDRMKTQLALIGQQQDALSKPSPPEVLPPSPPKTQPVVVQSTPQPVRSVAPAPAPAPARSPVTPTAIARPTPQIDPDELWAQLATTASVEGEVPLAATPNAPRSLMTRPSPVLVASATLGAGTLAGADRPPTAGEQGILQQQPVEPGSVPQSHSIPIGSYAKARVVVPMIWGGEDSALSRSAVRLSEPLLDMNGEEALPEDTVFITEVTNIASNGLVEQTAIVALYHRNGELIQEPIPPGVIVIRGRRNQPLVADRIEPGRGVNLSRSLASAIAGVGRELGEPEFVSSVFTGSRTVSRSEQDTGQAIAGGALEGFFDNVSDQMGEQTRDRQRSSTPIFTVEEGERVSVMVNGFLEVYR
ncbi:MAG: hypothetical protein MUF49_10755 [Oculatellaceae cyanobacterium Prado106]|jgi:hypothetical protein|nr:hypothetical protein [Oculatellaceae cyanobacterium Prado106]